PAHDHLKATDNGLILELTPNGSAVYFTPRVTAATTAPAPMTKAAAPELQPTPVPSAATQNIQTTADAVKAAETVKSAESSAPSLPSPAVVAAPPAPAPVPKSVAQPALVINASPTAADSAPDGGQSGRVPQQRAGNQRVAGGTLSGQVVDQLGGLIVGATVTIKDASGMERATTSDDQGRYSFTNLSPGTYTLRVASKGFADYENANLSVEGARNQQVLIKLNVAIAKQEVVVAS
ncbi:MAG: carboxypeptidase-like regulatory domain-containing protein, partial [Acidobacteriota bacterium]|nr:carboxypeptidase-like regulatory domain-containing protein [Acidobacteriota bacterium]